MAGYPKIWTAVLHEPWFVDLSLAARGFYLQLLLIAKEQGDSGLITARGWTGIGSQTGCDPDTARKLVGKFRHLGKIKLEQKTARKICLSIPQYEKYQRIKKYSERNLIGLEVGKNPDKSPDKAEQSKNRIDQTLKEVEQTEFLPKLNSLKIHKSYFDNLCKEFPTVDHQEELKCADLYRQGKVPKGKRNDHLFLRNWFKNAIKFKEKNSGKGKAELNKYDQFN